MTSPAYWGLRNYGVEGQIGETEFHKCEKNYHNPSYGFPSKRSLKLQRKETPTQNLIKDPSRTLAYGLLIEESESVKFSRRLDAIERAVA